MISTRKTAEAVDTVKLLHQYGSGLITPFMNVIPLFDTVVDLKGVSPCIRFEAVVICVGFFLAALGAYGEHLQAAEFKARLLPVDGVSHGSLTSQQYTNLFWPSFHHRICSIWEQKVG